MAQYKSEHREHRRGRADQDRGSCRDERPRHVSDPVQPVGRDPGNLVIVSVPRRLQRVIADPVAHLRIAVRCEPAVPGEPENPVVEVDQKDQTVLAELIVDVKLPAVAHRRLRAVGRVRRNPVGHEQHGIAPDTAADFFKLSLKRLLLLDRERAGKVIDMLR